VRIVLEYPSVGATENILMAATLTHGTTTIINAALEPEVMDLIAIVRKMGAKITIEAPATIIIEGVTSLQPVEHAIIPDRLEAGALLLAAAITGGTVSLPQAHAYSMDVFLMKLEEMGHEIIIGSQGIGVTLKATKQPKAVSFKTAPYPGFPTDLQAPIMAALCLAEGKSIIEETVFENRLLHVRELQKMGAQIKVEHNKAIVLGVDKLYGASVIATDIRASCALVLAGLSAHGSTIMTGIHHWTRGYEGLEHKLSLLGGSVKLCSADDENHLLITKQDVVVEQVQRN
jgi:UDP-N-acetylglucosamine 1-carboxyvinyltransferase